MKKTSFYIGALTDRGSVKKTNQDSIMAKVGEDIDGEFGLFIVADGMGGLAAGNIASSIAIEEFKDWWEHTLPSIMMTKQNDLQLIRSQLKLVFIKVNEKIIKYSSEIGERVGTTLSVLFLYKEYYIVLHIGDSRIYKINQKSIRQITEDHSWVGTQVRAGNMREKEAKVHPKRNVLTQCVGVKQDINPFESSGKIIETDQFLLCSDGFHGLLEENEMLDEITTSFKSEEDIQRVLHNLFSTVKRRGANDNVSAILICQKHPKEQKGFFSRLFKKSVRGDQYKN